MAVLERRVCEGAEMHHSEHTMILPSFMPASSSGTTYWILDSRATSSYVTMGSSLWISYDEAPFASLLESL